MNVLITGDRNWTDVETIKKHLSDLPLWSTIIHGNARGADSIADEIALNELGFSVIRFPAEWDKYGRAAGPIRNNEMLNLRSGIDLTLAFHNRIRESRGTKHAVTTSVKKNITTYLHNSSGKRILVNEQFCLQL